MATLPKRLCKECGKEFIPKGSRSFFCYDKHFRHCEICGQITEIDREVMAGRKHAICSKECLTKLKSSTDITYTKTCEYCGKEFNTSRYNQKFCNDDHYHECPICGKTFVVPRWKLGSKQWACSKECGHVLSHQVYQERYNKETNPERHAAMIAKQEATMLERYGYRNALSREGRDKSGAAAAFRIKYGASYPGHVKSIQEKRSKTSLERYGNVCPLVNPDVAKKAEETLLAKYGVDNYAKSTEFLKQVIVEPEKATMYKEFKDNPAAFINGHFPNKKPTLIELSDLCGIRDSSIGYILDQMGHPDIVDYTYSRMEDELFRFLSSELGSESGIQRNTFKIITPYELDIYLPDYNFAIECDPTITHNSTIPGWSENDKPKSSTYHKMKTDKCEEKDIFLMHIFGYDWSHHSEIIKSMIRNVINSTPNTVYARKTRIKEVSDQEAIAFLNANHRQGGAHSKYRLGLVDSDGELVSLMTFSRMRPTIGVGSEDLSNCYELVRFCNKINTNVVGGASKLFKAFITDHDPEEIRSFSDRAHTTGKLYEVLGFKYDHTSDPGYMWVDLKTDRGYARNNAQKQNIKKFLNDDTIDLDKTEVQIMKEHNFVQVFDSGVKLWIWRKEISDVST